jgi:sialic acid synthase SpsE
LLRDGDSDSVHAVLLKGGIARSFSMSTIRIGNQQVGDDQPCFIVAEIGINHNGDVDFAKRLISVALAAGCDAIKFQKRTVDVAYTPAELAKPRENPFGPTNGDLKYAELNLRAIPAMVARYGVPVGYSGHETGIPSSVCAAALGACCVERHITTDRAMWGSDHAASLEPNGISRLLRDIRLWEQAKGDGIKRVYEREVPIIKKLRRVGATV